jgi:hypothetical protein
LGFERAGNEIKCRSLELHFVIVNFTDRSCVGNGSPADAQVGCV